jgi:hypothetical protein
LISESTRAWYGGYGTNHSKVRSRLLLGIIGKTSLEAKEVPIIGSHIITRIFLVNYFFVCPNGSDENTLKNEAYAIWRNR